MKLTWPFRRPQAAARVAVACGDHAFAYAEADRHGRLQRCGLLLRGAETAPDFARRVRALELPSQQVIAVLPLADGQLLQVEAPAVRPEELKAAARWKVKDLVAGRVDELTMDVLRVGDDRPRPSPQIFVAAARTRLIGELAERCRAAGLDLAVVDLAEMAQRNLQAAQADADGLAGRATAALVQHGEQCLLTVCAGGELFYARRLDWDEPASPAPGAAAAAAIAAARAAPVNDLALASVDFIDYGADPDPDEAAADGAPRLVVELQRSFDLWERSWPDLPLAALWVQAGDASEALAAQLQAGIGLRTRVLDAEPAFPGWAAQAGSAAAQQAVLPLLGALLRQEERRL